MRVVRFSAFVLLIGFTALPAALRASETVEGRDVTVGQSVAMSAFLRYDRGVDGTTHVEMWEMRAGRQVQSYDIDMTKIMHLIAVSDDLSDFQHVHPILLADGHFAIDLRLNHPDQAYHLYFDGRPHGDGRHVFRFDLPALDGAAAPQRLLHAAGGSARAGPYTLKIDPTVIPVGEVSTIAVRVFRDGRPANDLHPYLGVMAHGVLIGANDLAYMHAHGMTEEMLGMMSGANDCGDGMMAAMTPMPPDLNIGSEFEFEILAPSAQQYDFWIQFIGGKTVYTAPLLVTTR